MRFQDTSHLLDDVFANGFESGAGVKDNDTSRLLPGFREKSLPDALVIVVAPAFHRIQLTAAARAGQKDRQVEHERQIWFESAGREPADFPELARIESAA